MTPQFTDMSGLHSPLCLEMALVGYSILLENRHTYAMATKLRLVYPVLRYLCFVLAQYQGNLVVQHLCLDSLFAISVNAPPEHMRLLLKYAVDTGALVELARLSAPVSGDERPPVEVWHPHSGGRRPCGAHFAGSSVSVVVKANISRDKLLQRWFENRAARRFGRNGELLERPITMQRLYPFWRCVVHCELFCSLIPVLSPYSLRTLQFERGACRYCQGLAE